MVCTDEYTTQLQWLRRVIYCSVELLIPTVITIFFAMRIVFAAMLSSHQSKNDIMM